VTRGRSAIIASASRRASVAMTRAVVFALYDDCILAFVVAVDEKGQEESGEEEYNVYDAERKARLEHRTCLVDIQCPRTV